VRWTLVKITVICAVSVLAACGMAGAHTDWTPAQVKAWIDTTSSGVLVDVRELYEYCDSNYITPGHIPGAVAMPWTSGYFEAHYHELRPSEEIVIVCRSGNRSNQAANFLDGLGFTRVFDMLGGMNAWTYETENCTPAGLPHGEEGRVPGLVLERAFPNPFSSSTEIAFSLPGTVAGEGFSLKVYDARGRLLATLEEGHRVPPSGRVIWGGKDDRGQPVSSGLYFYQLRVGKRSITRRVVVLR
jgi:rhodanese-related sulfurtransferase